MAATHAHTHYFSGILLVIISITLLSVLVLMFFSSFSHIKLKMSENDAVRLCGSEKSAV